MIRDLDLLNQLNEDINAENEDTKRQEIISEINSINVFSLKKEFEKSEELFTFYKNLDKIYFMLTKYILSGVFRKNNNLVDIIEATKNKITEFDENNEGPYGYLIFINDFLKNLINDIEYIKVLNLLFNNKNEDIFLINNIKTDIWGGGIFTEATPIRLVFLCAIESLYKDFQLGINNDDSILKDLFYIHHQLDIIKGRLVEESHKLIVKFLSEKITYTTLKIGIVFGEKKYNYYDGNSIKTIKQWANKQDSSFFESLKITRFFFEPKDYYEQSKDIIHNYINLGLFSNSLSLRINTDYFKGKARDNVSLTNVYKNYKIENNIINQHEYKTNQVYIGDSLLSLRVSLYKEKPEEKLGKSIKGLFHELIDLKQGNYFPFVKYADFKIAYIRNLIDKKNYNDCEKEINKAKKMIYSAITLFYKDKHFTYFDFNDNENYIKLGEEYENIGLKWGYCFNLYKVPFNRQMKIKYLESIQRQIFSLEQEIIYEKNFSKTESTVKSYKNEAMTIIGIFTGIVVFAFSEIQIFSNIEDLGSIILITGIYIGGLLILLFGIFYGEKKKAWRLGLMSGIIILLSILAKYLYGSDIINVNKGNNLIDKLETKIQQAQTINDRLENNLNSKKRE